MALGFFSLSHADDLDYEKQISAFIDKTAHNVLEIIKSPDPEEAKRVKLIKIFFDVVDVDWMSKAAIAKFWRTMNDDERSRYSAAYRNYVASSYVNQFTKYHGQTYTIVSVKDMGGGQYVATTAISATESRPEITVSYKIKLDSNEIKIRDILGEGVSLLVSQRSDFSSIIEQEGINGLIQKLISKTSK